MPGRRALARRPASRHARHSRDRGDLPRARLHRRVRPRGRDGVVQLRRAELPAGPSGAWTRTTRCTSVPGRCCAHTRRPCRCERCSDGRRRFASSRPATSIDATSSIRRTHRCSRRSKGCRVDEGVSFVDLKATLANFARRFFGAGAHALSSELLSVHGTLGRDGRAVRRLRRLGLRDVQGHRLARDPRQRDGAPGRARRRRHRQRAVYRLGIRHGPSAQSRCRATAFPTFDSSTTPTCVSWSRSRDERLVQLAQGLRRRRPARPTALRDLITSRAATVDAVETLRDDLRQFVVARVVECARHPDSDHLSVTKVDAGTGELLDVVCGAPNVQAGKLYPFAKTGTKMPAGFTIERRKIRGAVSNGMLCSAREIGLGEEQDGILELDIDVPPGTPLLDALPSVSDSRIVVDVGANRPDLLSHLGVAREVAAALGKPLLGRAAQLTAARASRRSRSPVTSTTQKGTTGGISVRIDDVDGCPRYLGVVDSRRTRWPEPRLARETPRRRRRSIDQQHRRHHELHAARLRPADARVRCDAPRADRRSSSDARGLARSSSRSTASERSLTDDHVRHRRRRSRPGARWCHGRS